MSDPILLLAVANAEGTAVALPLFAAVNLTNAFVNRLRMLTKFCKDHRVRVLQFHDPDPPVYWDVPAGSELEGCVDVHTQWHVRAEHHWAEWWGRRSHGDGSFGLIEMLGHTQTVTIWDLEDMLRQRVLLDCVEFDDTEAVVGQPFLLAVHERLVLLKVWPPDLPIPG